MLHCLSEIGPPSSEVVVDVEAGDARGCGPAFQSRELDRHRLRLSHQGAGVFEIKIVDDVDEQESGSSHRYRRRSKPSHRAVSLSMSCTSAPNLTAFAS